MKKLLLLACIVFSAPVISVEHKQYHTVFLLPVPETVNASIASLNSLRQADDGLSGLQMFAHNIVINGFTIVGLNLMFLLAYLLR